MPGLPQPILIGYSPRLRPVTEVTFKSPSIGEVASMSTCILKPPDGWIEQWRHNDFGLYDTELLARGVCPADSRCDLYAYAAIPLLFEEDGPRTLDLRSAAAPMPPDYHLLGYDVVCWDDDDQYLPRFNCSPLSCNGMFDTIQVNACCLLDSAEAALKVPPLFYEHHCEPGPYLIVQVWRKTRS